jgi:hypothetical protein
VAGLGGDFARETSAILEREVDVVGRLDIGDGVPLDRYVARELGLQQQCFAVTGYDFPG